MGLLFHHTTTTMLSDRMRPFEISVARKSFSPELGPSERQLPVRSIHTRIVWTGYCGSELQKGTFFKGFP